MLYTGNGPQLLASGDSMFSATGGERSGSIAIGITGTFAVAFEATMDGTNWYAINVLPVADTTPVTTAAAAGIWQCDSSGLKMVRVRCTSGTPTVTLQPVTY